MAKKLQMLFTALVIVSLVFLVAIALPKPEQKPVAFFAYGTNLDASTMLSRSGGAASASPALLQGYRLAFQTSRNTEFGIPNLEADASSSVPGAIYFLSQEQSEAFDKASGIPDFYRKISVKVKTPAGSFVDAYTHVLSGQPSFAPPSKPTILAISKGLDEFGYSDEEKNSLALAASDAQEKSGRQG
ncbi:TPA: gamma-glutamylcyclotransferase [Candidatus Micrarchaeota archaeon]|nr:gamma-glutamylcyclotransferase [Candidatus Micrarchaeota archaeon]